MKDSRFSCGPNYLPFEGLECQDEGRKIVGTWGPSYSSLKRIPSSAEGLHVF